MAYHSFPWCGDAWVALDILTPSPKKIFRDVAHKRAKKWLLHPMDIRKHFPLVFDFSEYYNSVVGTNVPHLIYSSRWKERKHEQRTIHNCNYSIIRAMQR
jgi:hypothetical protein